MKEEEERENEDEESSHQVCSPAITSVMEEHMEEFNKEHKTYYSFERYYDDVVNERIKVHYDWKQLLGMKE